MGQDSLLTLTGLEPQGVECLMKELLALTGRTGLERPVTVVNLDLSQGRAAVQDGTPCITVGETCRGAMLQAGNLRPLPGRLEFEVVYGPSICRMALPVLGGYDLYHALGALAACLAQGLTLEALRDALPRVRGMAGVLEQLDWPGETAVVLDSAGTVSALERSIHGVRALCTGRLLVALAPETGEDFRERCALAARLAQGVYPGHAAGLRRALWDARPGDWLLAERVERQVLLSQLDAFLCFLPKKSGPMGTCNRIQER